MKYLFLCTGLLLSSICNAQLISDSMMIEGHYRVFHYNKPSVDLKDGSLLFLMHGSGGSANEMIKRAAKLESSAADDKLLVVYPEGYQHFWNECRRFATSNANKENINEQAFFKKMIEYFSTKYSINKKKVYATGFSGGGHMSYKLGLTMPHDIAAIAAVVANLPDSASNDCSMAGLALPVMIINGTLDKTNPYEGGEMFVNNASYGVVRSTEKTFRYWASLAGYRGVPEKTLLPDTDPNDERTIEKYTFKAKDKPEVTMLKVIGGKHDYPGDIDVWSYVWNFFKGQSKDVAIHIADPSKKIQVVETACGECQFHLPGTSCDLAVRINGKAYFVDGTNIDAHGDAHAKDGFCNSIRKAEVQGVVVNNRFVATYLKLIEN